MTHLSLAALNSRGFRLFCAGNLGSLLGTWAQRVAVMWLAWELTQSTVTLGLIAFLDLLPALLSSPLGGTLADRDDRVRMAVYVQYASVLPPLILALASVFGWLNIELLLVVTVMAGLLNGIDHPLRLALVSSLVPPERVPGAVSINSMIFNISRMAGPALGGLAIAAGATTAIFLGNLISFVAFALVLGMIRPDPAPETFDADGALQRRSLPWSQVWRNVPRLQRLTLLYLMVLCLCLRPVYEMLPAFAARLIAGDTDAATSFALMSSSVGMGAFIGAIVAPELRSGRVIILLGLVGALAIAALAWIDTLWLTLVALSVSSGAILAGSIATQILVQTGVPAPVRGKVLALYAMILRAMPAIGAFLAGIAAVRIDLALVFVWSGLPVVAVAMILMRALGTGRR